MTNVADPIPEAVRRIVAEAHPLSVVVFGSAARGDTRPDSDLDFMVVMPDGTNRLDTAGRIHHSFRGLECPSDLVVVWESEVEALRDNPNLIIHTALTEGREVYHVA
ncbi:MAG: nucleotidyltransferase domain-containing protein [Candidatus Hydrogenedentes bacterium]|nr:nucleotidyltransferase domain-containing protein [Candidatus Hydrogenedentota bacterium]